MSITIIVINTQQGEDTPTPIVPHYHQQSWHKEQELFDYLIMTMMIIIISSGGHSVSPLHPLLHHHLSPIRSPDP